MTLVREREDTVDRPAHEGESRDEGKDVHPAIRFSISCVSIGLCDSTYQLAMMLNYEVCTKIELEWARRADPGLVAEGGAED